MDWLSILNQCLDIILPSIASVVAVLFGVLGTKIKTVYNNKVQNETVQTVIESVVRWAQQVYEECDGATKLSLALEKASTILTEKGIAVSTEELEMLIESAVYGLKEGIITIEETPAIVETEEEEEEETPIAVVETVEDY